MEQPLQPPQLSIEFVEAVDGKPAENEDEPLFTTDQSNAATEPQKEQQHEEQR